MSIDLKIEQLRQQIAAKKVKKMPAFNRAKAILDEALLNPENVSDIEKAQTLMSEVSKR